MPLDVPRELAHVLEQLRRIDEAAVDENGVSQQFLETEKSLNVGEELRINGNPQGLIHLARLVLEVAEKGVAGAHQHFDRHGNLDRCDQPVVIVLKAADWG